MGTHALTLLNTAASRAAVSGGAWVGSTRPHQATSACSSPSSSVCTCASHTGRGGGAGPEGGGQLEVVAVLEAACVGMRKVVGDGGQANAAGRHEG